MNECARALARTVRACAMHAPADGCAGRAVDSGKARAPSALLHLFSLTRLRLRLRLNLESHFPIFVHAVVCPEGTRADTGL